MIYVYSKKRKIEMAKEYAKQLLFILIGICLGIAAAGKILLL